MEVVLSGMPRRKTSVVKSSMWNLFKPGGWEAYEELTDNAAGDIEKIVVDENLNIREVVKKFETLETRIKYSAFCKA